MTTIGTSPVRSPLILVAVFLAAGCGSSSGGGWTGDAESGLAVRASAEGALALGGPMKIVVEARNSGTQRVSIDTQELLHQPYRLWQPDGRPALFVHPVAGGLGTSRQVVTLEPGATLRLSAVDLSCVFAILEPGEYIFQFAGLRGDDPSDDRGDGRVAGVPASERLALFVGPGVLRVRDQVLRRLLPVLPKGWGIHQSWGDPEDDPAGVRLEFLRDSLPGSALRPSFEVASFEKKGWRRLGPGPGGTFWISDLRFSGKADRQPLDGAAEVDLRESMLPKLEATLREALRE